jgi:hypothetical protein
VGTPVHWRLLDRHSVLGRTVHRADAPPDHQAILHDLSVTGARLFAPADAEIVEGGGLEVQLGDQWSYVEVAWIGPSPAPRAQWCGVRFVQPSQRFMAEVFQALDTLDQPEPT